MSADWPPNMAALSKMVVACCLANFLRFINVIVCFNFSDTKCYITGWGRTRQGGSTSPVLREASVPIISDENCKQNYRPELITSNMICAGFSGGGIDACQGDSGGKAKICI